MKVKKELYLKAKELAESSKVIFDDTLKNKSKYKIDELAWRAVDMAGALNNAILLLLNSFVKDDEFDPDEETIKEIEDIENEGEDDIVVDKEEGLTGEGTGLDDEEKDDEFSDLDDDAYKDIFDEDGIDDEETGPLTDDENEKVIKINENKNRQEDVKVGSSSKAPK